MEGDCNVYAHSSLWMRPTRPDRYNAKMVYSFAENRWKVFALYKSIFLDYFLWVLLSDLH